MNSSPTRHLNKDALKRVSCNSNITTNSSDFTESSRRCDLSLCGFQIFHNPKFAKTQVAFKLEDSRMVNEMPLQVAVPRETLATIRTAVQVTATMHAFVQAQSAGSEYSLRTY